jgi:two-component system LytT family response regulator
MSQAIRVFIVDNEQRAIDTLSRVLTTFFDNVVIAGTATNVADAYEGIRTANPQLVFLDIKMESESGFQLLEKFEQVHFHVAFVTAHEEFALKAIKFSALDYIIKPASVQDLKAVLLKVEQSPVNSLK